MRNQFHNRIWFIGIQGSYACGEADDQSDIDVVLILDTLSADDLETYALMLDLLPNRDKICGFISGKKEILSWEASDLFQFCYDTTPILGTLDELVTRVDKEDIQRAVVSVPAIHTTCVHIIWFTKKV